MFPVIIPATIVSPPRTRGLPAARATLDSRLSGSQPPRPTASASGAGGFRSGKRSVIIGMIGDLFDVLDVANDVVFVQHKNSPALDAQVFDQGAVGLTEGAAPMVGQHLDSVHTKGSTPSLLCKWQVHAYRYDIYVRQLGRLLIEAFGLQIANRSVKRRNHADDAHVVACLLEID